MDKLVCKLGFWSAAIIALLVALIDVGMILSTLLFPITTITSIETYASSFTIWQMLPFIPSLILAPTFVVMMLCIHHYASEDKKTFEPTRLILRVNMRLHTQHSLLHTVNRGATGTFKQPNSWALAFCYSKSSFPLLDFCSLRLRLHGHRRYLQRQSLKKNLNAT